MSIVVLSIQNTLLAEAVATALRNAGTFRVEQVLSGSDADVSSLCILLHANILVMEVNRRRSYTLESRLKLIDSVRKSVSDCKFVMICDENSDADIAHHVVQLRLDRRIDTFLYTSATPASLRAALQML